MTGVVRFIKYDFSQNVDVIQNKSISKIKDIKRKIARENNSVFFLFRKTSTELSVFQKQNLSKSIEKIFFFEKFKIFV